MPGEFRKTELIDGVVVTTLTVDDSHSGWRADNFLRSQYKYFSRNKLQGMIDAGRIKMDAKRLKASTTLYAGEQLLVVTEKTEEPVVDTNYKILFEDEHLLVIDKPGNLPVHPAGKFLFNTLLMTLRKQRAEWLAQGHNFFIIHRLDRETSGVILLGKTSEVAGELVKQFRERQTEKRYWAITDGHNEKETFTVDADMGSDKNSHIRLKMAAFPKGQGEMDALTHFKVLERGAGVDLVDCELKTGRQHQIRVHLAWQGTPIVGDKLYGKFAQGDARFLDYLKNKNAGVAEPENSPWRIFDPLGRHALHSRYLKFFHPRRNEWFEMESQLPDDMARLLKLGPRRAGLLRPAEPIDINDDETIDEETTE